MTKGHDKGHKGQMSVRETMKLALEALENAPIEYDFHGNPMDAEFGKQLDAAIAALRQALEQPEREWKGLTDDEKWSIFTSKDWTGKPLSLIDAVLTAYEEQNNG